MSKPCLHIDIDDNSFIVKELAAGSEKVFDAVYRSYFRRLCAFCSQYIKEQNEIEEIVQSTMLWLWENNSTLIEGYSLKSLLFTIVKNKAINRISHFEVKRKVHQEIFEKYEHQFSNPDFYSRNELFQLYQKTLEQLPDKYKESFLLSRNQGLSHNEIAKKLNVSIQTVNYRIGQSLKLLRVALKDYLVILPAILLSYIFNLAS